MMRRMMKTLTTLVCAALLGVAACGGKEADRGGAPVDTQPSSTASGEPTEAPAQDQPASEDAAVAPSQPKDPSQRTSLTPDGCRIDGGTFVPSIGSEPTCPDGKKLVAPVMFGVEGGICCK